MAASLGITAADTATAPPAQAAAGVLVCADKTPRVTISYTPARIIARGEATRCVGVGRPGFRAPVEVRIEKLIGTPGMYRWMNWSAFGANRSYGPTDMVVSMPREPGRFRARARIGKGAWNQTVAVTIARSNPTNGSGGAW